MCVVNVQAPEITWIVCPQTFLPGNPIGVNFLSIFSFFILEPALLTSVMDSVSLNNVGAVTISCVPKLALAYLRRGLHAQEEAQQPHLNCPGLSAGLH